MTKGKSMISEEIGINHHLEANGIAPVETDLGEYIIQLRNELPSHIIAPAVHLNATQVEEDFRRVHTHLDAKRDLSEPVQLLTEARAVLRERFLAADVGITGANFLVAETGTSIIVTNEGNGDLTQILPKTHIVLASIEKLVPTLEDVSQLLRVLARSATGQEMSVYTTFSTGPRRRDDADGPENYHVVILDNGRSAMLGTSFEEMLRCIRCGACMNHCPVYHAVGGHAYGWVYPGPMGAVLTPIADRRRQGGPPAQRLDLLRALRERVPGADPAAEAHAPLARAGIRAAPDAGDRALRPEALGLLRQAPCPLPPRDPRRHGRARPRRPPARPLRMAAAGEGLDQVPRLPGAAGRDLPGALEARAQGSTPHERPRRHLRQHPPLARRQGQRRRSGSRSWPTGWSARPRASSPQRGQVSGEERIALFRTRPRRRSPR